MLLWDSFSLQKLLFQQLCKKYSNSKYSKLFAHLFWLLKRVFHHKQEYSIPWPEFHFCIKSWLHSDGCYVSASFIIDNFDRSGSGSASSVMDAPPSVFRTQLLGTKGAPPKTLHTRTCFFRSQLRRVFLKKCNTTPTLPSDLDWWHLRTLVVVWRLLEWLVKKYDHEMLLWVNIVTAHPWLGFSRLLANLKNISIFKATRNPSLSLPKIQP